MDGMGYEIGARNDRRKPKLAVERWRVMVKLPCWWYVKQAGQFMYDQPKY